MLKNISISLLVLYSFLLLYCKIIICTKILIESWISKQSVGFSDFTLIESFLLVFSNCLLIYSYP